MDWLLEFITIPRFELVVAWGSAFIGSMLAGAGWAMYHTERRLSSRHPSPPLNTEVRHETIIDKPKEKQNSRDSIRQIR